MGETGAFSKSISVPDVREEVDPLERVVRVGAPFDALSRQGGRRERGLPRCAVLMSVAGFAPADRWVMVRDGRRSGEGGVGGQRKALPHSGPSSDRLP